MSTKYLLHYFFSFVCRIVECRCHCLIWGYLWCQKLRQNPRTFRVECTKRICSWLNLQSIVCSISREFLSLLSADKSTIWLSHMIFFRIVHTITWVANPISGFFNLLKNYTSFLYLIENEQLQLPKYKAFTRCIIW